MTPKMFRIGRNMKSTGKSIFKILFVLLILAVVGLATTLIYIFIEYDISPGFPKNNTDTLVIGVVSPYGDGTFFKDTDFRLPDEETAIELVLYDFEAKKSYDPEELGFSYSDFEFKWENRFLGIESGLDGTWPLYNNYNNATIYNAYSLSVEYTGAGSEEYTVLSNTIGIVCKSDYVRKISQFEEETVYAYPGRKCVLTLAPEFENSEVVINTSGNVSNSIVVKNGDETIAVSENAAKENSVRFWAEGKVSVIVKNESDVDESFTLYAGYDSLSDYIGAENGMDLALKVGETRYIQIDDEFDDNLMPTYNEFNVYDVFVNADPSISFKVYDMMTGSDPFAEFSGEEGTIRNSFICNFPSPLVVAITNNSDSEKSINVVIKRSDAVDFTDTTAESVTVFDTCALLIKIPSPGTLKLVCDRILNEDVYVAALNARCEVLSTKMLTDETQISINGNAAFLWIINRGNPKFGLMAEFIPD